jgi:cytochrome c oxidase assembly protein subunit 15
MPEISKTRGLHRLAVLAASTTVLLLVAGALVTSNDAADSVPDWPLAYGRIIPPLIGGIRYEFTHRVIAGLVALLTVTTAIAISRAGLRKAAYRAAWTAVALVFAQALLGGIRVVFHQPEIVATAHATLAQIFFLTVVGLALFTSPWWHTDHPPLEDSGSPRLTSLAAWTTAVILIQLVLGAGFRHGAFGILPHLIGAAVVTFMVVWAGRVAKSRFPQNADIRRRVVMLHAMFGTQILLGFAAYWAVAASRQSSQPMLLYVLITVAHVVVGALTLAASVLLALVCHRLIRPATAVAANSSTQSVRA